MANDVILYRKSDGQAVTLSRKLAEDEKFLEKHGLFKMPDDFLEIEKYEEPQESNVENKEITEPKKRGRKSNK